MTSTRRLGAIAPLLGAVLIAMSITGLGAAGAQAGDGGAAERPDDGSIEVIFTPAEGSGGPGFCTPTPFELLAMSHSTRITPETFTLRITLHNDLCSTLEATAAIYAMPGNGVAWPQTLKSTAPVPLRERGVTEVVFTRGCSPEQYDVVVGATPEQISPQGPWHGPLLFPTDPDSAFQSWGCPPVTTTTTEAQQTSEDPTTTSSEVPPTSEETTTTTSEVPPTSEETTTTTSEAPPTSEDPTTTSSEVPPTSDAPATSEGPGTEVLDQTGSTGTDQSTDVAGRTQTRSDDPQRAGGLASTGSSAQAALALGASLVAAGVLLLVRGRRHAEA